MKPPIEIVEYNPQWPVQYQQAKAEILTVIGNKVQAIEHVGSTAVHGLGAKSIIDIMVAVRRLSDAQECIEPLRSIGYHYVPEYEAFIPERCYFHGGPPERHRHLHMVERTSDFWKRHLLFRNYLRAHPDVARHYHELKKELAAKYGSDREGYTDAKTSFIESAVARARIECDQSASRD